MGVLDAFLRHPLARLRLHAGEQFLPLCDGQGLADDGFRGDGGAQDQIGKARGEFRESGGGPAPVRLLRLEQEFLVEQRPGERPKISRERGVFEDSAAQGVDQ